MEIEVDGTGSWGPNRKSASEVKVKVGREQT